MSEAGMLEFIVYPFQKQTILIILHLTLSQVTFAAYIIKKLDN